MDALSTAIVGLVGALIGGAASVGTMWIQSRQQAQRDRLRMIVDLAIADHGAMVELVKAHRGPSAAFPLSMYVHQSAEVLRIVETRPLTAADLKRIGDEILQMGPVAEAITDAKTKPVAPK